MKNQLNIMTVDLEDYFCAHNLSQAVPREKWDRQPLRIIECTRSLLQLFETHRVKATFFVLGWIAVRVPDLISEIADSGHVIASHGYSHRLLTELSPQEFEEDLKLSLDILWEIGKFEVFGFRAPSFTLTPKTSWAVEILEKNGLKYDSSVFPVGYHPDYGFPGAKPVIHKIGNRLIEVPISCLSFLGAKVPCTGGFYFRLYPYRLLRCLFKKWNHKGFPVVFFIHPWELDPGQPRVKLPLSKRFRHYYNLDSTREKLERLLKEFSFTSIEDFLGLLK